MIDQKSLPELSGKTIDSVVETEHGELIFKFTDGSLISLYMIGADVNAELELKIIP